MAPSASAVEVADPRDDHRRLRLSWHPERCELIVSHWRDNVCVATTPVGVKEIAGLIGLLVQALDDAATRPPTLAEPSHREDQRRFWRQLLYWSRRHLNDTVSAVASYRRRRRIVEDGNLRDVA